jgi:hypothetical protein
MHLPVEVIRESTIVVQATEVSAAYIADLELLVA